MNQQICKTWHSVGVGHLQLLSMDIKAKYEFYTVEVLI